MEQPKFDDNISELLALINAERAKVGVKPLSYRPEIAQASELRAQEASQLWSHTRPNGQPYYSADDRIWGENLSRNYNTPQEIVAAWMKSDSHRKNMLEPKFTGACIGVFKSGACSMGEPGTHKR